MIALFSELLGIPLNVVFMLSEYNLDLELFADTRQFRVAEHFSLHFISLFGECVLELLCAAIDSCSFF